MTAPASTQTITLSDVLDLVTYEKARDAMRAAVIEKKRHRRVAVGDNLTFLFENKATVLFQIQEMVRTERLVQDEKIQEEIDAYAPLLPRPGELAATLFIEIPELARMSQAQVRETVNRFQGIEREGVFLVVGPHRTPAQFEEGHSKEEKMAAVHYLHFALSPEARAILADPGQPARIEVDHPRYKAEGEIAPPPSVRSC